MVKSEYTVVWKPAIKYLEMIGINYWSYRKHLKYTSQKAVSATAALAKMLTNTGFATLLETSDMTLVVVAGIIPVDTLLKEMSVLYYVERMDGYIEHKNVARSESHDLSQHRWNKSTKGRCIHSLIPNVKVWRKQGEQTSYRFTQFLTWYNPYYKQNLHRFLDRSLNCPRCGRMAK